ncbi:hypothetical protein PCE1_000281 [Barthelona sp. PCE]
MSQNLVIAVRTRPFLPRDDSRKLLQHPSFCLQFFPDTPGYLKIRSDEYFTDKALRTKIENGELEKHMADKHVKSFNFTHAFNSFICFSQEIADFNEIPKGKAENFASQVDVYQAIGIPMLKKSLEGYNATVFAYGQTGSGKSYSMMGVLDDHDQWGIIPRACSELFVKIPELKAKFESEGKQINILVECRYIEIYNEAIRDLLCLDRDLSVYKEQKFNMDQVMAVIHDKGASDFVSNLKNQRDELNRQQLKGDSDQLKRKRQVYNKLNDNSSVNPDDLKVVTLNGIPEVMGATRVLVQSFEDINRLINIGDGLRFKRATKMNAESSRSHSIFTVTIKQFVTEVVEQDGKRKEVKNVIEADMNLVDLAGSERANDTGASGAGLREGSNINRSLSHLGSVIRWLAATPKEKKKLARPSMRASKLTQMLSNALGGNCFTVMIAALSPSAVDFDQTLSTLRYAQVAAKITNVVKKNVSPLQAKVEELTKQVEEQQKLIEQLKLAADPDMVQELQEQLELAQQRLQQVRSDQDTVESTGGKQSEASEYFAAAAKETTVARGPLASNMPWLLNINSDSMWSGHQRYEFVPNEELIAGKNQRIALSGIGIEEEHALFTNNGENVIVNAKGELHINGEAVTEAILVHGDSVVFGQRFIFRFIGAGKEGKPVTDFIGDTDFQDALDELQADRLAAMRADFEKERLAYEEKLKKMQTTANQNHEKSQQELEAKVELARREGREDEVQELEKQLEDNDKKHDEERSIQERLNKARMLRREQERREIELSLSDLIPKINQMNGMVAQLLSQIPDLSETHPIFRPTIKASYDPNVQMHVSKVVIAVDNDGTEGELTSDVFQERYSGVTSLWNEMDEYGTVNIMDPEDNPFMTLFDPLASVEIGSSLLAGEVLMMGMPFQLTTAIFNARGDDVGALKIKITPMKSETESFDMDIPDDDYLEVGNRAYFDVHIEQAVGLPKDLAISSYVEIGAYEFANSTHIPDQPVEDVTPDYNHHCMYSILVTDDFLSWCNESNLRFTVFGHREQYSHFFEKENKSRDLDKQMQNLPSINVEMNPGTSVVLSPQTPSVATQQQIDDFLRPHVVEMNMDPSIALEQQMAYLMGKKEEIEAMIADVQSKMETVDEEKKKCTIQ